MIKTAWAIPDAKSQQFSFNVTSNVPSLFTGQGSIHSPEVEMGNRKWNFEPLKRRKFDIRQWFMVTSFNPLEAWIYDGCYLRFSGINFNSKLNREPSIQYWEIIEAFEGLSWMSADLFIWPRFKEAFSTRHRPPSKKFIIQAAIGLFDSQILTRIVEQMKGTEEPV